MDMQKIVESLHPLELKILPHLKACKTLFDLKEKSGLQEVEILRALQWLQHKKALVIREEIHNTVRIERNGEMYARRGLPERRLLHALLPKPLERTQLLKLAGLTAEELNACIGLLRLKRAILFENNMLSITPEGKKVLEQKAQSDVLLKKLLESPAEIDTLTIEQKKVVEELRTRKEIVKIQVSKTIRIQLTELGQKLTQMKVTVREVIDKLTPSIIREGSWKGKAYRRFDITTQVPKTIGGKRHFVREAMEYAKSIWLDMGFEEMTGPLLSTSFSNVAALFTAQTPPVREIQDTFFIKDPGKGTLPDKAIVEAIKEAHEHGGGTGSVGWRYRWNPDDARRNVLRTHTTVLSAKKLYALRNAKLPVKLFAVGRCFRNEALDWSHLFEFNQTEGIVIDEHANFRHLLGYLKEFFAKMGFEQARFRPAYFPYTEPSVEIDVYHPGHKKWIELGGAGMFRPEVVVPLLGKDVPVLAWGPGFDRIIMDFYKITDIRDLYRNDLKQVREMRTWMR